MFPGKQGDVSVLTSILSNISIIQCFPVLQNLFEVLGTVAKYYPECVFDNAITIRDLFLNILEKTLLKQEEVS